jgi:hypothetical protein
MQNIAQTRCCSRSHISMVDGPLYLTGIDLCQVDNSDLVSGVASTVQRAVDDTAGRVA